MADIRAIPRKRSATRPQLVHQFLVVLSGTDPLVWRRIRVPERYSFWDLHVAIKDAMGWLDLPRGLVSRPQPADEWRP